VETITAGAVQYRTRCLSIQAAGAFARCLRGNAKFTGIEIAESKRARGEKRWIVLFTPSNAARVEDMQERQQGSRAQRAVEQSFTFCLDKDSGQPFFWVHSHQSGEVYEVTEHSCSCPDAAYRLQGTSLRCKHQIALTNARREEILTW
jgi:predicted nucleic acid-binding Zn finger protein